MMVSRFETRLGAVEREQALGELSSHLVMGRLDAVEFDARCARVIVAQSRADLAEVFFDLPGYVGDASTLPRPWSGRGLAVVAAAIGLLVLMMTGAWLWLLLPVSGFVFLAVHRR